MKKSSVASSMVVIEPHADDAFLSVGGHIEEWVAEGRRVHIVTLVPVKSTSLRDAEAYARAVGASWTGYEMAGGSEQVWKSPIALPFGQVVLPLGGAPLDQTDHTQDHYNIRRWMETWVFDPWYYLDQPYAITQKNGERMNTLTRDLRVVSFLKPPARKYRHIPIFRSQSKFFHFNGIDKLKQTWELLLRK